MDSKWWGYLVEAGILGGFALIYYFFQRKRIIRADKEEIFDIANYIHLEIEKLENSSSTSAELQSLKNKLATCLESNSFTQLASVASHIELPLHKDLDEHIDLMKKRAGFYK